MKLRQSRSFEMKVADTKPIPLVGPTFLCLYLCFIFMKFIGPLISNDVYASTGEAG